MKITISFGSRFLFIFAIFFFATHPAHAGRYEIVKGKGVEVCEAYGKNLNSFNPKMPVTCGRRISSEFPDLRKPDWRSPGEMPEAVFGKIDRFLWERDANPVYHVVVTDWPKWKGTKEQRQRAFEHYLIDRKGMSILSPYHLADLDINGDGKPEHVLIQQACGSAYGSLLLVINQDYTDIDYEKTKLVMPHPSRKEAGWGEFRKAIGPDGKLLAEWASTGYIVQKPDSLHWAYYDVFLYKDKPHFDLWWRMHPDYQGKPDFEVGRLRVYSAEGGKTTEMCTYRFNRNEH